MKPRIIHFYWEPPDGSSPEIPADIAGNMREWTRLHPDFEVKIWSFDGMRSWLDELRGFPVEAAMRSCRFEAMRSDLARLALVYKFGGTYNDLKNRPILPFLYELEAETRAIVTQHPPTVENYVGRICNALFSAPPEHPFIMDCLNLACESVLKKKRGGVFDVTGAGVVMRIMDQRVKKGISDYFIVDSGCAWGPKGGNGGWMRRTSASYNSGDMSRHWSVRQKYESIYLNSEKDF